LLIVPSKCLKIEHIVGIGAYCKLVGVAPILVTTQFGVKPQLAPKELVLRIPNNC